MKKNFTHHHSFSGLKFASLLIVTGCVLLLLNLNVVPAKYNSVITSWQILLIIIGLVCLFKKHFICGTMLLGIGTFFIIPLVGAVPDNFIGNVPANFTQTYWSVLLILAGVLYALHRLFGRKYYHFKMSEFYTEFNNSQLKKNKQQREDEFEETIVENE